MRNTRGDLSVCLRANPVTRRDEGRAEVSRGHSSSCVEERRPEHERRRGTTTLTDEVDADRKAEMPEDSRKERGGTSRGRERGQPLTSDNLAYRSEI